MKLLGVHQAYPRAGPGPGLPPGGQERGESRGLASPSGPPEPSTEENALTPTEVAKGGLALSEVTKACKGTELV